MTILPFAAAQDPALDRDGAVIALASDPRSLEPAVAGGKAAALAAALRAGERVPPGCVVTPAAFRWVLLENGLLEAYELALAAARREDLAPMAALAERLDTLEWPPVLEALLETAAAQVGAGAFAVRSSATTEDGESSAAAGVFGTYLDVPAARLTDAVTACWRAAHRPAVFTHLLDMGLDPGRHAIAVLIQRMLVPELAGVLFTVDPLDPSRERMRLALAEGRGDQVVDGEGGSDFTMLRAGTWPRVGESHRPHLRVMGALGLRELGLRLEKRRGRALDLEWAVADGQVHLLQARPIATLSPGAEQRPPIRWSRDLAEERFPDPISPLGWSALQSALAVNLSTLDRRFGLRAERPDEVATVIGGYVYNNRDFFKIPGSMRPRPSVHRRFLGAYLREALGLFSPSVLGRLPLAFAPRRGPLAASPLDPRLRMLAGLFRAYVFAHAHEVETAWEATFALHMAAMDALDAEDPAAMDDAGLVDYIHRLAAASDAYMEPDLAIYVIKMACRWLIAGIGELVDGHADPAFLPRLTGGLTANATLEMNEALDRLVTAVGADSYLAAAMRHGDRPGVLAAWPRSTAARARDAFLKTYGHVTLSWDLRQPTYADSPELLDELLATRLRAAAATPTASQRDLLAEARDAEVERVAALLAPAPWAPTFWRKLVEVLHTFMRLDEEHHLFCARLIPAERRLVAEIARRLIARGALDTPDDAFFLTLPELEAVTLEVTPWSRRRLVARRRAAYERAIAARPVDEYVGDHPISASHTLDALGDCLQGTGASVGVAEGRVRLVATLADMAAFQPGEVLVTVTPKPSYTPLFAVAAALVTARGSTLSHGLVSAREYGLPAVTEILGVHERLVTGQRVRVDGATGTVTILDALTPAERT